MTSDSSAPAPPPRAARARIHTSIAGRWRTRALAVALAATAVIALIAVLVGGPTRSRQAGRAAPTTAQPADKTKAQAGSPAAARRESAANTAVDRYARLGVPVYCGAPGRRLIALTLDDGPGSHTAALVRLLRRAGAPATFFEIGRNAYRSPALARIEASAGVVGDHTWSHPRLATLPAPAVRKQLAEARIAIAHATDNRVVLFRPPYESDNARVNAIARHAGLLPVLWSVDSRDWAPISLAKIERNIASQLRPGAIILLHEQGAHTLAALRWLLDQLPRHRLRPVTVPQLLALDGPTRAQLHLDQRGRACAQR